MSMKRPSSFYGCFSDPTTGRQVMRYFEGRSRNWWLNAVLAGVAALFFVAGVVTRDPAGAIVLLVLTFAYWAPTVTAVERKVQGIGQVVVVNLFLGWTFVGWVVALVMAFRHVPERSLTP